MSKCREVAPWRGKAWAGWGGGGALKWGGQAQGLLQVSWSRVKAFLQEWDRAWGHGERGGLAAVTMAFTSSKTRAPSRLSSLVLVRSYVSVLHSKKIWPLKTSPHSEGKWEWKGIRHPSGEQQLWIPSSKEINKPFHIRTSSSLPKEGYLRSKKKMAITCRLRGGECETDGEGDRSETCY